ncbi:hypothetical protein LUZ60_007148 [Juncus effusus]|nr:hypothetical protein LUZ60_007148 [Juncus effusus]
MATEEEARSTADPVYKTKVVQFLGRTTPIVLQNENGPCPLLAICNVLLLRNVINLSVDESEVNQQRLLSLVAERLIDSNSNIQGKDESYVNNQQQNISDAIDLLPQLAKGLDVNMHFGKINDFEFTRECAIFDLLDIALYHGWIVDPQDAETASVIGSKSYNTLVADLVNKLSEHSNPTQSTQSKSTFDQDDGQPVDFAAATTAALGVPSPSLSRGLSFEEGNRRRGDLEEEEELNRILDLSKEEKSENAELANDVTDELADLKIGRVESSDDIFAPKFENGEKNEGITFPMFRLDDSSSLDVTQFVKESTGDVQLVDTKTGDVQLVEKTGEEQIVEKAGEESVHAEFVDEEPMYQGEEHIIMMNNKKKNDDDDYDENLGYETSPEPVYEGEVVLAEQFNSDDNNRSSDEPDDHKWQLIKNFLESNASQLTIYGLFCLQEGLKERELCVFFRNNHFSTMFKYNGELYLLATDQGYIHQPDLVWEKLNEVNGDTVFMTGNFTEFKAENRGNDSSWNEQQAMTSTADYLATIGGSDPSVSVTNPDLQLAIALQQQEFDQQQQQNRESQNRQQQNRESQQQQNRQQQPYPTPPPGSGRSRLVVGPQTQQRPAQNQPQRANETKKERCAIM